MDKKEQDYIVALVYTQEAGGYEGNVFWTSFPSKEEFDKTKLKKVRVLEENISEERALELVNQTPVVCRITASVEELKLGNPFAYSEVFSKM